ncbi:MAG: hypothetical protein WC272_06250 [Sulfurimonas sp.]
MLFDEIVFIVETILHEGLEQTKQTRKAGYLYQNKYMCRAGYDLYLVIESIYGAMKLSLKHYFPHNYEVLCEGTKSFSSPKEKWEYFTNEDFSYLTKVMIKFLKIAQSYHNSFISISYGGNLEEFFGCKNQWQELFSKTYCSGKIENDMLKVSYLLWAKPLERKEWDSRAIHQEPVFIVYDISSLEKRKEIEKLAQQNIQKIQIIMRELKDFMLKHCTLQEMLENRELQR